MGLSFIQKGAAGANLAKQNEAKIAAAKESQGKMWPFWLAIGEENVSITFVDGDLDPTTGTLMPPRYYEHNLFENGKWGNFYPCPEQTNPHLKQKCPICASGDRPSFISVFTVIDHRTYTSRKGVAYKDVPKLFKAKDQTMELLEKIAKKRGGLAGVTFDVMRIGKQSAQVGTQFDFTAKTPIEELKKKYTKQITDPQSNKTSTVCLFEPADYDKEITFYSADELTAMGKWTNPGATNHHTQQAVANPGGVPFDTDDTDYSQHV